MSAPNLTVAEERLVAAIQSSIHGYRDDEAAVMLGAYRDALLAAHDAEAVEKLEPQVWWCLEVPRYVKANGLDGNNGWWYGNDLPSGCHMFSWDFEKAVKFRTKEDAELVMRSTHMTHHATVTDHLVMGVYTATHLNRADQRREEG